ncbi:MAG: GNAT family N-acetyltransferase [Porphyromonadaceae bacterium]|nr:GNAT family N-acetyltransferase [Porphyromonadaceae bacterium]
MKTKLAEAEGLWRACFDDEAEFVRFYFDRVAREEEIYLYEAEGKSVAHIHAPRYVIRGGVGEAFYVSGACTLSSHRGRGIMHELMVRTMREEYAKGRVAALLIPADEELRLYYAQHFGFVTNNYRYEISSLAGMGGFGRYISPKEYIDDAGEYDVEQYVSVALRGYSDAGIDHTRAQVANVFAEYVRWGRVLVVADEVGELRCVALCREDERVFCVDALLGDEPWRLEGRLPKDKELRITLPNRQSSSSLRCIPRGMVRPLNLMAYTRQRAEQAGAEVSFSWVDDIIPQNTGTYTIEGGQLRYQSELLHEPLSSEALVRLLVGEYWMGLLHD